MTSTLHLDAAESVFFDNQLEYIKTKIFEIKFPGNKSRMFAPTTGEANPGATTVTYRMYEEYGQARISSDNSSHPPRVDISGTETTKPVRPVDASYGWHLKEVKSAAMAGLDLNPRRAIAARKAIERKMDEVAATGAPNFGIATGCLNDANVTVDASGGAWNTPATAATILSEVTAMWTGIIDDTNEVETANTLVLPPEQWAIISTLPRSNDNDTTVKTFIMNNLPDLTAIEPWHRLKGAGAGGVDRGWMYARNSETLENDIAQEFEQLAPQPDGFQVVVNCWAQTAGVSVYYPLAMRYIDGI